MKRSVIKNKKRLLGVRTLLLAFVCLLAFGSFGGPCAAYGAPGENARSVTVNYKEPETVLPGETRPISTENASPIVGLYLVFWEEPDGLSVTAKATEAGDAKTLTFAKKGDVFLQHYIDFTETIGKAVEASVSFPNGAELLGLYPVFESDLLADGSLPEWVHDWNAPVESADVLLLSSHADDEQLFFAGILPYYAAVRELAVQVVYFTDNFADLRRHQERLNGLWTCGIRAYPATLSVPDAWAETYEDALKNAERAGFDEEKLIALVRETFERFRPKVVITHDENGEYSHGQHILLTAITEKALADGWAESQSYFKRLFLHLYETNPITLSFLDEPFEALGGKTPFRVTQDGFQSHESQMWTWFRGWLYGKSAPIERATQIATYSPLRYGQYYGDGNDRAAQEGDFFAGLMSYREEKEEAEKEERERLERERQEREAEERRKAEEAEASAKSEKKKRIWTIAAVALLLNGIALTVSTRRARSKKRRGKH